MIFDWYKIVNREEFEDLSLVSRNLTLVLEGIGEEDVLITIGNQFGLTFRDVFLPLNFEDQNPFYRDGYSIYEDDNADVWLGIEVEE